MPNLFKVPHDLTRLSPPKTKEGWTKMGTCVSRLIQPPLAMVDRQDGTIWYLASRVVGGKERLCFSTIPPSGGVAIGRTFPAFEEPVLYGQAIRIFVRGGRLGYESTDGTVQDGKAFWTSLTDWWSIRYEVVLPATFVATGRPAFETAPDFGRKL